MSITKASALQKFWESFGLTAYNELTVPDNAKLPYITYELITDSFNNVIPLSASIWYKSNSWIEINAKAEEISKELTGGKYIRCNGGAVCISKDTPFAQRLSDTDKDIRRIALNITAEFLTNY